jgi:hypothetical protein
LSCAAAVAQQPRIDSLSPSDGPIAGGTVVTVAGANLSGATVMVDRVPIAPLSQSDSVVRLQMPKHDNGYALLQVGSAAAEFLYIPPRLEDLPPGYITTVAGAGSYVRLEQSATRSMVYPWGVTIGPNGDVYFVQVVRNLVLRVGSDGLLQHVAGSLRSSDVGTLGDGAWRPTLSLDFLEESVSMPREIFMSRTRDIAYGRSTQPPRSSTRSPVTAPRDSQATTAQRRKR